MTPGWQNAIVAASLHNVRGRSPIDLKMESQIPSKIRCSQDNETPARLSGGSSNHDYANESKNQKELTGRVIF
jgi:hypothetical protein